MIRHDTGRGAFMDIGRRAREPRPILNTHFAACRWLLPVPIRRRGDIHQEPDACLRFVLLSSFDAMGHLLSHEKEQLQIAVVRATKQTAELRQHSSIFALATPCNVVGRLALREIWQGGRLFSLVEKLVHGDLKGASKLFKCLNGRYGVAVLDAGNIANGAIRCAFQCRLERNSSAHAMPADGRR